MTTGLISKGKSEVELRAQGVGANSGLRKSATSVTAFLGSSPKQHYPAIPEIDNEDQGLMMSARPGATLSKHIGNLPADQTQSVNVASSPGKTVIIKC